MYQNNSYQTQTGQVAPEAQNPQTGSVQPYQQQNITSFQAETQGLLEGQSNITLVLPNGESSVAPSGSTSVTQVSTQKSSFYPTAISITAIILTIFIGLVLMKFALGPDDVDAETVDEESDSSRKTITVTTEETAPKKKPTKKRPKSSKKRKKK